MPEWNTLPIDGDDLIDATVTVPKLAPLAAAAPAVAGQVLVATSPTTWAWTDPPSGGQPTSVKPACRLLAFSNVALSGLAGIDGVVPADGDRILCVGQTAPSFNGIYVAAAGAWTRAPDANDSAEVTAGMYAFVTEGTQFHDTGWLLTTDNPIVLGVTDLVFTQFSGTGTAIAGNGLTRTGNTFDVVASADGSIVVGPDSVAVGVLNTDAQHGVRGGGNQHALAGAAEGFMSPAQVTKLAGVAANAAALTNVAPALVTRSAGQVGVSTLAAHADHKHDVSTGVPVAIGAANFQGAGPTLALSDHVHAHGDLSGGTLHALAGAAEGFMSPAQVTKLAASGVLSNQPPATLDAVGAAPGVSAEASRSDHAHVVNVGVPVAIGANNSAGSGPNLAANDHVHAHGLQTAGNMHAVATISANGFMSTAQVTKLDALDARRAATQTFSSTSYADVTALSIPISRVGPLTFDYWIAYLSSNASEGIGLQLVYSGTVGPIRYSIEIYTSGSTLGSVVVHTSFGSAPPPQTAGPGAANAAVARIAGSANFTSAGTLSLQARAETGGVENVTVLTSSYARVHYIP